MDLDEQHWNGRNVLVTGGAGFIGSHLVERLLSYGAKVRVLARYNSESSVGHLAPLVDVWEKQLDIRLGTVTDPSFVRHCVEGMDTVFHLAALIGIPYSYVAPGHYVDTNVSGTLNVLEACRSEGVGRVVHTSTSECFGSAQYVPMDELHPIVTQSPYSASKAAGDHLALSYHRSFDVPVVTLRPFNTFGPRQSQRAVIPTIIAQLLNGPRVEIGDLRPIRDLNPVSNTVDGFLLCGSSTGIEGDLFVIGTGEGHAVGDVLRTVATLLHIEPEIVQTAERIRPEASEVDRLVCNFERARKILGYEPRMSFTDGLQASIAYMQQLPRTRLGYAI